MELETKVDCFMLDIQKDPGKPKKQCYCHNKNDNFSDDYCRNNDNFSNDRSGDSGTNTNMINGMALALPTCATTTPAAPLNPTNDMMFAGLFRLIDAQKKKFQETRDE
jgi:hypothetical protein